MPATAVAPITRPAGPTQPAVSGPVVMPEPRARRPRPAKPIRQFATVARAAVLLVLALTMALLLGACGSSSGGGSAEADVDATAPGHHHEVDGTLDVDDEPGVVAVTMTDFTFATDDAQVGAGAVTFRVTNSGVEDHQMMVGRLKAGVTADQFSQTYADQGEPVAFEQVEWVGGANGIAPGATEEATSQLTPGDYVMVCFMRGADGTSHVMKRMVAPLTVVASNVPSTPPASGEVITVRDYAIEIPAGFRGDGPVSIRNEGSEPHEVALLRLADGKAVGDAFAWYAKPEGPPPFSAAGGIGVVDPATPAWASLHLEPGNYVAVCFVPGPDGAPHALMGMVTPFTVS